MRNPAITSSTDSVFSALSDPTRRAVLDLLCGGSIPAGEIARAFPVSRPAVSKHLRLLRHACLVNETRRSRHRLYSLNPAPLKAVDTWLNQYRIFWEASLTSLKSVVENKKSRKLPRGRRKQS